MQGCPILKKEISNVTELIDDKIDCQIKLLKSKSAGEIIKKVNNLVHKIFLCGWQQIAAHN
jgi:hypothetical protein